MDLDALADVKMLAAVVQMFVQLLAAQIVRQWRLQNNSLISNTFSKIDTS